MDQENVDLNTYLAVEARLLKNLQELSVQSSMVPITVIRWQITSLMKNGVFL